MDGPAEQIVSNYCNWRRVEYPRTVSTGKPNPTLKPENIASMDEFFGQVRTLTLGTAVASKAMVLYQMKEKISSEDIMYFASDLNLLPGWLE